MHETVSATTFEKWFSFIRCYRIRLAILCVRFSKATNSFIMLACFCTLIRWVLFLHGKGKKSGNPCSCYAMNGTRHMLCMDIMTNNVSIRFDTVYLLWSHSIIFNNLCSKRILRVLPIPFKYFFYFIFFCSFMSLMFVGVFFFFISKFNKNSVIYVGIESAANFLATLKLVCSYIPIGNYWIRVKLEWVWVKFFWFFDCLAAALSHPIKQKCSTMLRLDRSQIILEHIFLRTNLLVYVSLSDIVIILLVRLTVSEEMST